MEYKLQRKIIREGREMILKVYHFLKEEYKMMKEINVDNCDLSPLANVRKRTAEATGVSERTITKFLHEERILSCSCYTQRPKGKRHSKALKALGLTADDIRAYVKHPKKCKSEHIQCAETEIMDHDTDVDDLAQIKTEKTDLESDNKTEKTDLATNSKIEKSDPDSDVDCDEMPNVIMEFDVKKEETNNDYILGE